MKCLRQRGLAPYLGQDCVGDAWRKPNNAKVMLTGGAVAGAGGGASDVGSSRYLASHALRCWTWIRETG